MRSRIRIIADVLQVLESSDSGVKISELVRKSNVPYVRLEDIIEELIEKGLIKQVQDEEGQKYVITQLGIRFLNEYRKFSKFAENFGLEI